MKAKNCLIFGGSGQIGRNLIRKLTKNNYRVTVVTRNIHQKSYIIKTQANAGYIDVVEANIFDEDKIRNLFKKADICINLIGILFEKKRGNTFKNIHSVLPSLLSKLCKEYNLKHFIHLSALGINDAIDSDYAKSKLEIARSQMASPYVEAGMVSVHKRCVDKLLHDDSQGLLKFPNAKDDLNDAFVQAINRLLGQPKTFFF